jgi:hypothetical protein
MLSDVGLHVIYKIANAPIRLFPYPHMMVRDVFPPDFYQEIRAHLPPRNALQTIKSLGMVTGTGTFSEARWVLPLVPNKIDGIDEPFRSFWNGVASWLVGGAFGTHMMPKFGAMLEQRFGDLRKAQFFDEGYVVQDYTNYALGPHTDAPKKVLTFLFYLPADESQSHLGTSIYVPKDPQFVCAGGPHYPFDGFRRVITMPYLPNSLFAFVKTNNSFHGVEPVTGTEARRDLLAYDVKIVDGPDL